VGEGGFSAYGGNRTVNIGGNAAAPLTLTWGSTSQFLASGSKLILGSQYANATVDFKNGLNLNGANQTVEVLSPNSEGVGGKISGNITGTGASSLTKTGQGILTLAGTNSYPGSTFVNEGSLYVTGSLSDNASVEVAGGAELRLADGGTISAGALALDNAAKFGLEVGTLTVAPISISGTTTLTGSIALALTLIADPADGMIFTLIDSAMLAGYESGARFYYNGVALNEGDLFFVFNGAFSQQFQFSYHGGSDGADVTVIAVPEPSTAAVLLASTGLLLGLNRFRRHPR
jgi:autotransporter-associated beta strand protein